MTDTKKPRATRTPKSPEQISKGALSLPLAERVELKKQLEISIKSEVEQMKAATAEAEKIANGTL